MLKELYNFHTAVYFSLTFLTYRVKMIHMKHVLLAIFLLISACAPKEEGASSNVAVDYPVTASFGWSQRVAFCSTMGLDMNDPNQDAPCTQLFLNEVRYRLQNYYGHPWQMWDACQSNPNICNDPTRMESFAKHYGAI